MKLNKTGWLPPTLPLRPRPGYFLYRQRNTPAVECFCQWLNQTITQQAVFEEGADKGEACHKRRRHQDNATQQ